MKRTHPMCSWRAGCGETRKSGSEGGGEETTGRKAGTGASPPTLRVSERRLPTHSHPRVSESLVQVIGLRHPRQVLHASRAPVTHACPSVAACQPWS
jgi:hypothetical protein